MTYQPDDPIPEQALVEITRDAAALALMSREDRLARELARGTAPRRPRAPGSAG